MQEYYKRTNVIFETIARLIDVYIKQTQSKLEKLGHFVIYFNSKDVL